MVEEAYVSFETAKLLKEKGFDQNCATYYLDGQVWRHYHGEVIPKGKQIYAAPTQAVAMKWLREVHNLYIEITPSSRTNEFIVDSYRIDIVTKTFDTIYVSSGYNNYEEACEAALKYCLEKLVV